VDSSLSIFRVAHSYLEGHLTLDDVQEWLVPRLGIFLIAPRSTPSELAGLFELGFADVAAGEADEKELQRLIGEFLREHQAIELGSAVRTASTNPLAMIRPFFVGTPQTTFKKLEPLRVGG
jgi:hypothetical protein